MCRSCGGGAPVDVHFCPQCSKLLSLGRHGDYFSFLGLPRKLEIEGADLEQRFRALSRQFHPDYFYNATPAERRASLERSSYLNDAFRTLRDVPSRLEYLLQLELPAENTKPGGVTNPQLSPALLQEFFELNEELDEIRDAHAGGAAESSWKPRLQHVREQIVEKQRDHDTRLRELSTAWDEIVDRNAPDREERLAVLKALRERVLERNYIHNLLEHVEQELTR
jgi:molecular chaperone HscB